jgi:hypothetical protein
MRRPFSGTSLVRRDRWGIHVATSACWPDNYRWLKGVTAGETAPISDRAWSRYENFGREVTGQHMHRSAAIAGESGYLLLSG